MPKQQPKKKTARKVQTQKRTHPIPGMLYRVRDKDWAELWGEGLTYEAALFLKAKTVGSNKSTTARIEACDIPVADHLEDAALEARERARDEGRPTIEVATAPTSAASNMRPQPAPALDTQLANLRSPAMLVASGAAAEANQRVLEKEAAARRRAVYAKQREDAQRENERLAKEAEELEAEMGDAADVPEGDIDDFLGGVGSQPTDEEIRKAREASNTSS